MSTGAEELPGVSFEEFLRGEQRAERRHEFVGGRVYVMAGGSERHELVAGLVYEALAAGARAAGCRPFMANRLLRAGESAYYPDILIVCGPATDRLFETDATLIVEVSSPSTRDVDRREKATAYARLPGMGLYVLVDPSARRLEVAQVHQGTLTWQAFGPDGVVPTRYGTLVLDDLYNTLDATATTT
jgi:Uma2 family endonuclease